MSLRSIAAVTLRTSSAFGIDVRRGLRAARGLPAFISDGLSLLQQRRRSPHKFAMTLYPCLGDRFAQAGAASGHYFHQDLYVARRIHASNPRRHVDVGSRIDGFVAHVATFRAIDVIDIRPVADAIPNVRFLQADLMGELPTELAGCADSVSCLHALEHFGLGRYGDPIDYDGHTKGLNNLHRIVEPGGFLYLSVPIGPQRIEFNGHRVFAVPYLLDLFSDHFDVARVSAVGDDGRLYTGLPVEGRQFQCHYGCGIFELRKK